jgi:uncharacterized membrane protein YraQ (UPF0718 family)
MILKDWAIETWQMVALSAPWLLIGLFIAGLIKHFLPEKMIANHLSKRGPLSVLKSTLFGIPLPLCSCSVNPVALSLRKKGASNGATASVFVSTPEIGVDSFLMSFSLLGGLITMFRVFSAFISANLVGIFIDLLDKTEPTELTRSANKNCCQHKDIPSETKANWFLSAFNYAYIVLLKDIGKLLLIGYLCGGLITVIIPDNFFSELNLSELESMFAILLISLPMYVCATSSTPLAASLLMKGFNPGAILVFLLAGPASNITTMLAIKQELGFKSLLVYIFVISTVSVSAGIVLNRILGTAVQQIPLSSFTHAHALPLLAQISGGILALLLINSLRPKQA